MIEAPAEDLWMIEQVEAALAPYVDKLPAEDLAWMRQQLLETLRDSDHGRRLVRRARPVEVEHSGEIATSDVETPVVEKKRAARGREG